MKKIFITFIALQCIIFAKVNDLSPQELQTLIQDNNITIIDIRTPKEWERLAPIQNANKITFLNQPKTIKNFLYKLRQKVQTKKTPFVLVCHSSRRSSIAAKFLDEQLGYTNVSHLKGGMKAWKKYTNK